MGNFADEKNIVHGIVGSGRGMKSLHYTNLRDSLQYEDDRGIKILEYLLHALATFINE